MSLEIPKSSWKIGNTSLEYLISSLKIIYDNMIKYGGRNAFEKTLIKEFDNFNIDKIYSICLEFKNNRDITLNEYDKKIMLSMTSKLSQFINTYQSNKYINLDTVPSSAIADAIENRVNYYIKKISHDKYYSEWFENKFKPFIEKLNKYTNGLTAKIRDAIRKSKLEAIRESKKKYEDNKIYIKKTIPGMKIINNMPMIELLLPNKEKKLIKANF